MQKQVSYGKIWFSGWGERLRVLCELLRHGNLEPTTATLLQERERVLEEFFRWYGRFVSLLTLQQTAKKFFLKSTCQK